MATYICPVLNAPSKNIAIRTENQEFSYSQVNLMIENFCRKLAANPGPFIWQSSNELWEIPFLLACLRLGKTACPLSHRMPGPLYEEISKSITFIPEKPYLLIATSGSTGKRKLVALSPQALIASALGAIGPLNLTEHDTYHLSLPLAHVSGIGILFRAFLAGASILLCPSCETATHCSIVPTQLYRMLKQNKKALPYWKTLLLGGASISRDIVAQARNHSYPILTCYGLTESASLVTLEGSVLPYRKVAITSHNEIQIGGEVLFSGYYPHLESQTWHTTSDIGQISSDGTLEILGRKDSMMISGGENIFPEEIEKALGELPGVLDAIVIARPCKEFGQRPVAFIETLHPFESALLKAQLQEKLEKYKIPDQFLPMPELVTPGIKRSRQVLQGFYNQLLKK